MAIDDDFNSTPDFSSFGSPVETSGSDVPEAPAPSRRSSFAWAPEVDDALERAAQEHGVDRGILDTFARIESGGRPHVRTGSYKGLFQLSDDEFFKNGGQSNIFDAYENARAGAAKIRNESAAFRKQHGRDPTAAELYLIHQQGVGGSAAHWANPDAPAWQNMYSTAEGRQKGANWARQAIWGNVPDDVKRRFGSVDNLTSRDFVKLWEDKVARFGGGTAPAVASKGNAPGAVPASSPLRMALGGDVSETEDDDEETKANPLMSVSYDGAEDDEGSADPETDDAGPMYLGGPGEAKPDFSKFGTPVSKVPAAASAANDPAKPDFSKFGKPVDKPSANKDGYGDGKWENIANPQQYKELAKGVIPGAISMQGTALQAPDAAVSGVQHRTIERARQQLAVMDRIDAGGQADDFHAKGDRANWETDDYFGYQQMTPAQRAEQRARLEKEVSEFNPTPIQERTLYKAGQKVQEFAKGLFPAAPGYEQSVGRQLGEGLGSMVGGLPYGILGPVPAGIFFGAAGAGEATQRAIEFDKRERDAGRPGLTQEQIALSGLMGIAPGTTDLLPLETLMGRLPLPVPTGWRRPLAQAAGRMGGQAFVEGLQEGGQQFLQNLIAREVYNPDQSLGDEVLGNTGVGAGVGGLAQFGQEVGRGALRFAGRRGHHSASPPPEDEAQKQIPPPAKQLPAPEGVQEDEKAAETMPPPATADEAGWLRAMGWDDKAIAEMPPEQRADEIEQAKAQGLQPVAAPVPTAGAQVPDNPTAEPVGDLLAQAADLSDPKSDRSGLYVPASSLMALDDKGAEQVAQAIDGKVFLENFDGKGGLLAVNDYETAKAALEAKARGEDLQKIIGEATGAGSGKPVDGSVVVQQRTKDGAVVRESLVAPNQVEATKKAFARDGHSVEVLTPQEALDRRERLIAEQSVPAQEQSMGKSHTSDQNVSERELGTRSAPVVAQSPDDIAAAGQRVAEPTEKQAEAGNYRKGHIDFQGLPVTIETPKGGTRRGVKDGKVLWEVPDMPAHYGYVKGTLGRDGDHVDVFIGDNPQSDRVFVIDQVDAQTGAFDEHKVVLGTDSREEAGNLYSRAFSDGLGPDRVGDITEMSVEEFKDWLSEGKRVKPAAKKERRRYDGPELTDDEVDLIVTNWKYVRDVAAMPKPESLTQFVIANGGLQDGAREVRHIMGAAKERPGLVNQNGVSLDDMALKAWEAGFFADSERPTIADFLDKLQDDLHTGAEVRLIDQDALESVRIAAEIAEELNDYGVTAQRFRSEAALREYLGQERARPSLETEGVEGEEAAQGARDEGAEEFDVPFDGDTDAAALDQRAEGVRDTEDQDQQASEPAKGARDQDEDRGPVRDGQAERGTGVDGARESGPSDSRITGFKTAKGSTYVVHEDGTTTRNKAARSEHPGEEGPQPRSQRTYYVEDSDALGIFQTEGPKRLVEDGKTDRIGVLALDGPFKGKILQTSVTPFSREPKMGWTPVEVWKSGTRVHFGNKIVDITRPGPAITTEKSGQTSLVPEATTKEKIAAEAKAKERKGGNEPMDVGMFGSEKDQTDLVDMAKQPETEKKSRLGTGLSDLMAKSGGQAKAVETVAAGAKAPAETASPEQKLVSRLMGDGFKTIVEARKFAKEIGIEGTNKQIDEAVERAVVASARQIVVEGKSPSETFQALVDLYGRQPNLASRTGTSVANQAYSTPMPLAYLASRLAGVATADVVYEPTAGNGALLMEAGPGNDAVYANEIDPDRAAALESFGFTVSQEDGGKARKIEQPADAIVANPPFGAVKDGGKSVTFKVGNWSTTQIDHAVSLHALDNLTEDGRAVLILGGTKSEKIEERRKDYRGKAKREFYARLYKDYNVVDHFTVSGDLYTKQGASWPVDVIVIDGRSKSERKLPAAEPPAILKSWDQLAEKLPDGTGRNAAKARSDRKPAGRPVEAGAEPASRDGGNRQEAVGRGSVSVRPEAEGKPSEVRAERDRGEPADVGSGRGNASAEPRSNRDGGRTDQPSSAEPVRPRVKSERKEGASQVPYEPVSAVEALDTLIPVNMANAAREAMEKVEKRRGSLDKFVAERLGYESDAQGPYFIGDDGKKQRPFAAEQIDAISAAIDNIERGAAFINGAQCVAGHTRIYDPISNAYTSIKALHERGLPITVLALTPAGLRPVSATKPFRKGIAELFEITLEDGRAITVTGHHRFLTPDGWRALADGLRAGCSLGSAAGHPLKSLVEPQSIRHEGDPRSSRTPQGSMGRYSACSYPYGEQPQGALDNVQEYAPSPAGVLGRIQPSSRMGVLDSSREHSHQRPDCGHRARNSSSPSKSRDLGQISSQGRAFREQVLTSTPLDVLRSARSYDLLPQEADANDQDQWLVGACGSVQNEIASSLHASSGDITQSLVSNQSVGLSSLRHAQPRTASTSDQSAQEFLSCHDDTSWVKISSIEYVGCDEFFDMWVPGFENYVAEGLINHNTGIGKGRVAAGVLRYAMKKGMTPVFLTEKPDLYGDMFRDLRDIGVPQMLGREPRMFITNAGESITLDEEALAWKQEAEAAKANGEKIPPRRGKFLTGGTAPKVQENMRKIANGEDIADVIFTTYDQMNTVKGQDTPRRQFLSRIAPQAIMVLDEAHVAGGQAKTGWESKNAVMNRADFARELAGKAKGVMFSSATYAKRPDVMDLYARTDMGKAVDDPKELGDLIQRGGVPMQQIVASMLAKSGQYMRHERSFDGVDYQLTPVKVDLRAYKQFSASMQAIFRFDLAVEEFRDTWGEDKLDEMGWSKSRDDGVGGGSANSVSFGSLMHNITNQMLLAIKAEQTAQQAIEAHKAGEKPVIALANTNESFIKDFAEAEDIKIGQPLDLDFSAVLERYLARTLRVTVKGPEGEKQHLQIPVDELPLSLRQEFRAAMNQVKAGDYSSLPISPIDWIRFRLGEAGMSVKEVTGRQTMIDYSKPVPTYVQRPKSEQGASGKRGSIAYFNSGKLDALVLNRSGSTGVSMHASEKFKDQRKRRMIIAQPEGNIDTHCLDAQTEILTPEGFKGIHDAFDMVAAFDPATGVVTWQPVTNRVERPLGPNESMFGIQSPGLDVRVTDQHRMLMKHRRQSVGWRLELAGDLGTNRKGNWRMPVSGVQLPAHSCPLTDHELHFIGWVLTDGTINHQSRQITIWQAEHQPHHDHIKACLAGCGFKYGVTENRGETQYNRTSRSIGYVISLGQWRHLQEYLDKDFPVAFEDLDRRQLSVLLEALHLGDGTKFNGQPWTRRSYHIATGRKTFADRLQSLCIRRGFRANVSEQHYNQNPLYMVRIKDKVEQCVGGKNHNDGRPTFGPVPFEAGETVWCVENSVGTLITRRNGKVAFLGNCQMLGRVHRTGQVVPPAFTQIAAEIPAEARPTAVLMKKMASLNANTTGARSSAFTVESVDFINEVGDKVVADILMEDPELNEKLGGPLTFDEKNKAKTEDVARKATGRLVLLDPDVQAKFLDQVQKAYLAEIEQLDALGENPLEAKTVDLQAKTLETSELKPKQGDSPFLDAVRMEKVSAKAQGRAMPPAEVVGKIAEAIKTSKPSGSDAQALAALEAQGRSWGTKETDRVATLIRQQIAQEVAETGPDAKESTRRRLEAQYARWQETMGLAYPGARVRLGMPAGDLDAIVMSVERTGKAKQMGALGSWTVKFAVPDSMRQLDFPMSKLFPPSATKAEDEKGATLDRSSTSHADLVNAFEEARKEGRETRYIMTGNILGGFDQTRGRGRIVNFTDDKGELRPGILMGREFSAEKFMDSRAVRFSTPDQIVRFMDKAPLAPVEGSVGDIELSQYRDTYRIETSSARAKAGQFFTDKAVRNAIAPADFQKRGAKMVADDLSKAQFVKAVAEMQKIGAKFEVRDQQDLAQSIVSAPIAPAIRPPVDRLPSGNFKSAIPDIRQAMGSVLKSGRPVTIKQEVVDAVHAAVGSASRMVPNGTRVFALARVEPTGQGDKVIATFEDREGFETKIKFPWASLSGMRALYLGGHIYIIRLNARSLRAPAEFDGHVTAELGHEVIHALRRGNVLVGAAWDRLLRHAKSLRLLDSEFGTYAKIVGDLSADKVQDVTVREVYEQYYSTYPDPSENMDQEEVAHMMEWYLRGVLSPAEVAPVRDLLDAIERGELAEISAESQLEAEMAFAVSQALAQRRALDHLGFYSQALEAAKGLKQAKGTPEQMRAQLRSAGVKEAELVAVGLDGFLEGKKSVTKAELVGFIEQNRVGLREATYGTTQSWVVDPWQWGHNRGEPKIFADQAEAEAYAQSIGLTADHATPVTDKPAKWSSYSIDPSNPTYRETVIHLPPVKPDFAQFKAESLANGVPEAEIERNYQRLVNDPARMAREDNANFTSGHWSEPNVIAHARTSLQKTADGKTVFLVDELQSDWGQKLRDGGVRDEAKIAELTKRLADTEAELEQARLSSIEDVHVRPVSSSSGFREGFYDFQYKVGGEWHHERLQPISELELEGDPTGWTYVRNNKGIGFPQIREANPRFATLVGQRDLLKAEVNTAKAATPGHPLVNTTDQWTTTAFRRLIRQAVEAGADYIALTPGKVQNERFNLANFVDALRYDPATETLFTRERGHPVWEIKTTVAADELHTYVGKEMAEKLLAQPLEPWRQGEWTADAKWAGPGHTLRDLKNVEIGGQGMKATYDSIYPRTLGKMLAKMDKDAGVMADMPLTSSYKGNVFRNPDISAIEFHTFPLTSKVKEAVMEDGQPLFAIGGVKAKTADLSQLARAQQMEVEGATNRSIWKATGWFKRADGWRFEIDDSQITFNMQDVKMPSRISKSDGDNLQAFMNMYGDDKDAVRQHIEDRIKELIDRKEELRRRGDDRADGDYFDKEADNYRRLLKPLEGIQARRGLKVGEDRWKKNAKAYSYRGPLGDLLNAPDLFAAYPQLKSVEVRIGDATSLTGSGSFSPTKRMISVVSSSDLDDIKSTLLHEIQHGIQIEEGFDAGGNDSTLAARTQVALFEVTQQIENLPFGSNMRGELERLREELRAQAEEFSGGISGWASTHKGLESYSRLLGEVEARNVENRIKMDASARAQSFPLDTEDMPAAEQYRAGDLVRMQPKNRALIQSAVQKEWQAANLPADGFLRRMEYYGPRAVPTYDGVSLNPAYQGDNNPTKIAGRRGNVSGILHFTPQEVAEAIESYGAQALLDHLREHVAYAENGPMYKDQKTGNLVRHESSGPVTPLSETSSLMQVTRLVERVVAKHPEVARKPGYVVSALDTDGLIETYQGRTYTKAEHNALTERVRDAIAQLEGTQIEVPKYDGKANQIGTETDVIDADAVASIQYDFDAQGIGHLHGIDGTYPQAFAELYKRNKALIDEYRFAGEYLAYAGNRDSVRLSASFNLLGKQAPDPSVSSPMVASVVQGIGAAEKAEVSKNLTEAINIINRIAGKDVDVQFVDRIETGEVSEAQMAATEAAGFRTSEAGGGYRPATLNARAVIALATKAKGFDLRTTAGHEAWHHVEERLANDAERRLLKSPSEMRRMRVMAAAEIGLEVGDPRLEKIPDTEIRAIAFQKYRREREEGMQPAGIHIGLRRFWDRVLKVFAAVRGALKGKTFEDIFEATRTGEIASRAAQSPSQVRENDGRVGDVEASDPNEVMASLIPRVIKQSVNRTMRRFDVGERVDRLRVGLQDKFLPVRRIQEEKERQTGARIPINLDTYVAEALYHGRAGEQSADLKTDYVEPLLEIMRKNEITKEDFDSYLYARHAGERNAAIRQIDKTNLAGSGMTDAEANAILAAARPKQAAYDQAAKLVDDMIEETRKRLLKSGLISRETFDEWSTKFAHYVPLRGFEAGTDEPDRPRTGRGFDIRGPESLQALGRRSKADSPLAYAISQAETAIIRAEKNRVDKTLFRFIQAYPDPALYNIYRGEYRRRLNPTTRQVESYWVPPSFVRDDAIHGVKIGGKQYYMELKDPGLARAMRGVQGDQQNAVLRGMMTLSRFYASLLTSYNPEFVVSNFFRDIQTALANVTDVADKPEGVRRQMLKDAVSLKSIRGVYNALRGDGNAQYARWFEEYRHAGGKISFMEFNDVERIQRDIMASISRGRFRRVARKTFDLVNDLNTAVENGVRLSAYIAMRKAGIGQDRAAFVARELTVNFNRKGEWSPVINSMYLFFNASVQGTTRMAQAIAKSRTLQVGVASIMGAAFLFDWWNYMIAGDDDDGKNRWDKLETWKKERNLIIMTGRKDGSYIQIPMPYGYNLFWFGAQQTGAVMRGAVKPHQAAVNLAGSMFDVLNPVGGASGSVAQMASPTMVDPFVQVIENKTWYGGPIYPTKWNKHQPDSESYFASAPAWARDLARTLNRVTGGNTARSGWFDISPEVIEHFTEFAGGGVAKFANNVINAGGRAVNGQEWLPEKTPFVRRLYGKATTESRRRDFYQAWEEVDAAKYEVDNLIKNTRKGTANRDEIVAAREKYKVELQAYEGMKSVQRQLAAMRKQRTTIELNRDLSSKDKEERLKVMTDRENQIILRALGTLNRLRKQAAQPALPAAAE